MVQRIETTPLIQRASVVLFAIALLVMLGGVFSASATQAFADTASESLSSNDLIVATEDAGDELISASGNDLLVVAEGDKTASYQGVKARANDQQGDNANETNKGDSTESLDKTPAPVNKPTKAGWMQDSDGTWYYFNNVNATPKTGWVKSKGKWYWLEPSQNGAMATNTWITDQGKRYYVDANGVMKTGWIASGDDWYYANKSGALIQNGWVKVKGKWYWLQGDKQGLMAANQWITDKNKNYYLTSSGAMATKWFKIGSDWYFANKSGAQVMNGWQKSGGKWYWLDAAQNGKMATNAWIADKNKRYYLDANGVMATKWIQIGSDWYYANKSGAQQTGWVKSGGKWYWLQADKQGLMAANENLTINGALYSFTDSGAMRVNTVVDYDSNKVGYATSSGAIIPVGVKENGKLVLRNAQGAALTGWQKIGGAWFYGDEGGVAHTGWLELNGKKYWLDSNGMMATGERVIDGKSYVFSSSGAYLPVSAAHAAVYERALKELKKCTNDSMTKEQKLRAAYDHVINDSKSSLPRMPHMKAVGWETVYADDIFLRGTGNCFSYAAAFAFMAKAIGYENVHACHNGTHGWVEIDGLCYDPHAEMSTKTNMFGYSYGGAPKREPWMYVLI